MSNIFYFKYIVLFKILCIFNSEKNNIKNCINLDLEERFYGQLQRVIIASNYLCRTSFRGYLAT